MSHATILLSQVIKTAFVVALLVCSQLAYKSIDVPIHAQSISRQEQEPNEDPLRQSNPISIPAEINGLAIYGDAADYEFIYSNSRIDKIEDFFRFSIPPGQSYRLDIVLAFNNQAADLDLFLFREENDGIRAIAVSNGDSTFERISTPITLGEGEYFIGVSASDNPGNTEPAAYTLSVNRDVDFTTQPSAAAELLSGRLLQVRAGSAAPNSVVTLPVLLTSEGNESSLSFSLSFNPAILTNPRVSFGSEAINAILQVDQSRVAEGRIGVRLSLPEGQSFVAGVREIARVSFLINPDGPGGATAIGFSDQPVAMGFRDSGGVELSGRSVDGSVAIVHGFEADLGPIPASNGTVTADSLAQIGRFVAGIETASPGIEFQRADCWPESSLGDGRLTIADWVQAGRYAAGIDAPVSAGGPTRHSCSLAGAEKSTITTAVSGSPEFEPQQARVLRLKEEAFNRGRENQIFIELESQGDENAFGFTLDFDPSQLGYLRAVPGPDAEGAVLNLNTSRLAEGLLGVGLALPSGQTFSPGTRQLIKIYFNVPQTGSANLTLIAFDDLLVAREIVDAETNILTADYYSSVVSLTPQTNPAPVLADLDPAVVAVAGPPFTLIINGSDFINGAVAKINGLARSTTFVNPNQLRVNILSEDLIEPRTAAISVTNPGVAGVDGVDGVDGVAGSSDGSSNSLDLYIVDAAPDTANNPTPSISRLSPNPVAEGSAPFTLTVTGSNFATGAQVRVNNSVRSTIVVNNTQLKAQIMASDVARVASLSVRVFNPEPGGGLSGQLTLEVKKRNPVPRIAGLTPDASNAGLSSLTLTVNGSSFVSGAVVRVGKLTRTTNFVNSTQLRATLTSQDLARVGTLSLSVVNPGPGGGFSNPVDLPIGDPLPANNPTPSISVLSPNPVAEGSAPFTLTVTGSNFATGAQVRVNNSVRSTIVVNNTQLKAQIMASDVARVASLSVRVFNPEPGGGLSGQLTLEVKKRNPVPRIAGLTPDASNAGLSSLTLTVNGSSFVSGAVVRVGKLTRTTNFVNSTQLRATLTSQDLARVGTLSLSVVNPGPGGGFSNPISLPVGDPLPPNNPVPFISKISPTPVAVGSAGLTLTLTGSGFATGAEVRVNGTSRSTILVNSTKLTAQVPASDLARVASLGVQVFNPEPGGGTSNRMTIEVKKGNPVPRITSISPQSVNAGGSAQTLTVNGSGFVSGAVVMVGRLSRTTNYVSGTQLSAVISSQDIAKVGLISMSVVNPAPGGGTSNPVSLTIDDPAPASNRTPSISEISPALVAEGSPPLTLTVTGSNFATGAEVRVNGSTRPTTVVSSTQLIAQIPATDLAQADSLEIKVFNPAPGGGTSNSETLEVMKTNPVPRITNLSPDLVNAGSLSVTLTLNGSGFVSGSTVIIGRSPRTTTFISETQLRVTISSTDIMRAGLLSIKVTNPEPGGGNSNSVTIKIVAPVRF